MKEFLTNVLTSPEFAKLVITVVAGVVLMLMSRNKRIEEVATTVFNLAEKAEIAIPDDIANDPNIPEGLKKGLAKLDWGLKQAVKIWKAGQAFKMDPGRVVTARIRGAVEKKIFDVKHGRHL